MNQSSKAIGQAHQRRRCYHVYDTFHDFSTFRQTPFEFTLTVHVRAFGISVTVKAEFWCPFHFCLRSKAYCNNGTASPRLLVP